MIRYEVDLRDMKTGDSVQTAVYVTFDSDEAWRFVDRWNQKHITNYNPNLSVDEYICSENGTGLIADCYYVEL